MSPTRYYQLGGFRPDIRWFENDWDDKKLVGLLAGPDSPLRPRNDQSFELVLGIKNQGTSHLLLSDTQTTAFERAGNRRPYRSTTVADYGSVSPIYFNSASELQKKLKTLKPKAKKGRKEEPLDTSQANKAYVTGDHGVLRGQFEHGRVLYRLLQKSINPAVYSLSDISWTQNIRIISFLCNLRAIDSRPYDERQRTPRPLDYGWAEANVRDLQLPLKQGSAVHLRRAEDRLLGTGRLNVPFEHGTTLVENQDQISLLAQQFFSEFQTEHADTPTILLVYDEKLAYNALRELGIQTSSWKSGISGLLRQEVAGLSLPLFGTLNVF
ncbi:hypothetical protein P691DRAFT_673079 [Macrolepiota fuliginosa MF-IS2]|uniref:Uncharacterized protein n=1 Tax=Macrolepiota fuliginosa MF-IS2 TaxID=1400762 RepID=A0A9P5XAD3_9AGAR|nr:hypothetical protein P691DRAFT_673079 [Macrolepiota fuliginosa MF-IS2]